MDVTIRKPAVIAPSQIPRMKRTANSPPKDLHAACAQSATDQMNILTLDSGKKGRIRIYSFHAENLKCWNTENHGHTDGTGTGGSLIGVSQRSPG